MTRSHSSLRAYLTPDEKTALERRAIAVRRHVLQLAARGGCYVGASLSCVDALVYLYSLILNVTPDTLTDENRDYFLLSKGHAVPALYGTLVELGFIPQTFLDNHLSPGSPVYWHPNAKVPGVEFHSGSLGHALSVGMGIAADIRMRRGGNRVFVMTGDGELNEGSIWEAMQVAAALELGNLTLLVDRNGMQANCPTEDLIPLEPLQQKFHAFGWSVARLDGHEFYDMHRAFLEPFAIRGMPRAFILDTVRGKGVPAIEGRSDAWFMNLRPEQADALIAELT